MLTDTQLARNPVRVINAWKLQLFLKDFKEEYYRMENGLDKKSGIHFSKLKGRSM